MGRYAAAAVLAAAAAAFPLAVPSAARASGEVLVKPPTPPSWVAAGPIKVAGDQRMCLSVKSLRASALTVMRCDGEDDQKWLLTRGGAVPDFLSISPKNDPGVAIGRYLKSGPEYLGLMPGPILLRWSEFDNFWAFSLPAIGKWASVQAGMDPGKVYLPTWAKDKILAKRYAWWKFPVWHEVRE